MYINFVTGVTSMIFLIPKIVFLIVATILVVIVFAVYIMDD